MTLSAHPFKHVLLPFLITLVMISTPITSSGAEPAKEPAKPRSIVAVMHCDYRPVSFWDNTTKTPSGFFVDIMDNVAARAGIQVNYLCKSSWDDMVTAVENGEADLAVLMKSKEREKKLLFSAPIEITYLSYFARSQSNAEPDKVPSGRTVGVIKGSMSYEHLKDQPGVSLQIYSSYREGLFGLLLGEISLFAGEDSMVLKQLRETRLEDRIKKLGKSFLERQRGLAVRKDNLQLHELLDKHLDNFVDGPEYRQIYVKWYGAPTPYWTNRRILTLSGVFLFISVSGMTFWRYVSISRINTELIRMIAERKRADEALRTNEALLKAVVESSADTIFVKDLQGKYVLMNKAGLAITGRHPEEVIGKDDAALFPPAEAAKIMEDDKRVLSSASTEMYEHNLTMKGEERSLQVRKGPILDEQHNILGVYGISRDITENKRAAEELQLSRQKLALHVSQTPLAVIEFDLEGRFREWNPAATKIFGFSREEAIGQYWTLVVPKTVWKQLDGVWASLVEQRGGSRSTNENCTKSGRIINCEWFNTPLIDPDGKTIGVASLVMDVTERKNAEKKLFENEERFRLAMLGATDGLWDWNLKTDEVYYSPRWKSMLGYPEEELENHLDTWKRVLHPDDREPSLSYLRDFFEGRIEKYELEFRLRHKDGSYLDILSRASLVRGANGEALRLVGTHVDITDRKRTEKQIQDSLEEKEVLLKEIHHRVKNNMQVIISLLNLQAKGVADKRVRAIIEESRDRVYSMALIHEKLYGSTDLSHIDFKEYLQNLVQGIADTYKRQNVVISVDMENIALNVNVGIPCGLIVNELVSNSLKYAFPEGKKGMIKVGINRHSKGNYVLTVADNGIGFPDTVDFRNSPSLGLQLVNVLSGQIRGTMELSKSEGASFSITFPGDNS